MSRPPSAESDIAPARVPEPAIDYLALSARPTLRRRRPLQSVAVVLLAVAVAATMRTLATNPGFGWDVVLRYFLDTRVLGGLLITLELTVLSMLVGFVVGFPLAVMRMSDNWLIHGAAGAFIWFFRGTPLVVQLLFWGFAAALFPVIGVGIPFGGPKLVEWDTNTVIPLFVAAVLGLGLNEAAYEAEIVRAGLLSVPAGQTEACRAMGFGKTRTLWFVVIPQAMRVIIPPVSNNVISMLKTTSLVIVLGVGDLLYNVQQVYAQNLRQIPLLIVASIWHLLLTTLLNHLQRRLERRYSRGTVVPARRRIALGRRVAR